MQFDGYITIGKADVLLQRFLQQTDFDRLFILCDDNTRRLCFPLIEGSVSTYKANIITINPGEKNKTLDTLTDVWRQLIEGNATRHSLLLNVGGGMIGDLGGFAAATYKRGIEYCNIPTSLLSMVDASAGGKTAIDFMGMKNLIGSFSSPKMVFIDTQFLNTLPAEELMSGYAEMLKHALLDNENHLKTIMSCDILTDAKQVVSQSFENLIHRSISVKSHFAGSDPLEAGIRKALNLGHTIGHAIESWSNGKGCPMTHGRCVAHGIVGALYLSCIAKQFPTMKMRQVVALIREIYGRPDITCDDTDRLLQLMSHDKKNIGNDVRFTLLDDVGQPTIDNIIDEKLIVETLDFIREG